MGITIRELNRAVLARQGLLSRAPCSDVVEAVRGLAALQAQLARPPYLALHSRYSSFDRDQLHAAYLDRRVVRGTLMRGTLHTVAASDYLAWRPVLQEMLAGAVHGIGDIAAGLDLDATVEAARELLADGPLTFAGIRAGLAGRFPDVNERGLGYAVRTALPLVMAPTDDRWSFPGTASFTLAESWLGTPLTSGDAGSLVRAHLRAYGPATAADVAAWAGVPGLAEVVRGMRDELWTAVQGRKEWFDLPDAPRPGPDVAAPPRLLPDFDPALLGYADRTRLVPAEHKKKLATKNLRVLPVYLLDGTVAGTWEHSMARTKATLTLRPFEPGAPLPEELTEEALRMLRFAEPDAASYDVAPG